MNITLIILTDITTDKIVLVMNEDEFKSKYGCVLNSPYRNVCLWMIEVPQSKIHKYMKEYCE